MSSCGAPSRKCSFQSRCTLHVINRFFRVFKEAHTIEGENDGERDGALGGFCKKINAAGRPRPQELFLGMWFVDLDDQRCDRD